MLGVGLCIFSNRTSFLHFKQMPVDLGMGPDLYDTVVEVAPPPALVSSSLKPPTIQPSTLAVVKTEQVGFMYKIN